MKKTIDYTIDEIKLIITIEKFNDALYCNDNADYFVETIDDEINSRIDFCDKMFIELYQLGIKRKVLHMLTESEKQLLKSYFLKEKHDITQ